MCANNPQRVKEIMAKSAVAILAAAVLVGTRALAGSFDSGIISFDYNWSAFGYVPYGPGPGAIGGIGDLWNSVSLDAQDPRNLSLMTTAGKPTSVVWYAPSGGASAWCSRGPYGKLFDVQDACVSPAVRGLTPNQAYNLYLYDSQLAQVTSVNGVTFSTPPSTRADIYWLGNGVHYDMHTVVADSSGTLSFQDGLTAITAWQLTPVPEPSLFALAGLGASALMISRRRLLYALFRKDSMIRSPNQSRQPTPGICLSQCRASAARRGCAHR